MINTVQDVGYYYSELIDLGVSSQQTIQLDAMDEHMTKVEAPAGFEKAKIGVQALWSSENMASTFYISNPLRDLELGMALKLTGNISSQGYEYQFYKYIYDQEDPIHLDMTGEFTGWLYNGHKHPVTKEVTYFTEYHNPNGVVLTNVGPERTEDPSNQVHFQVIDANGNEKQISTNHTEGFVESQVPAVDASTNLLNYQIYKNDTTVGDVISTTFVNSVTFMHPTELGDYQLKLENQLFPTDVVNLQLDQGFTVYEDQSVGPTKFSVRYSDSELPPYEY
jgi:hypothetical protein